MRRDEVGVRGETRGSGLWGTGRGGGRKGGRGASVGRALLALLVVSLATPLAASAGPRPHPPTSYLAPTLARAAARTPHTAVHVIVQSELGASRAEAALDHYGHARARLGIVRAVAGEIAAGDLTALAARPGLVITPDEPVVLDDNGGDAKAGRFSDSQQPAFSSSQLWPAATGVEALWPSLGDLSVRTHDHPAIAVVDSGIEASRPDFRGRVVADVDLTSLPDDSSGDGNGHGTVVAGLAAGSGQRYAGAAPTADLVSLDVMDDHGGARTSDVIRAAQWILRNRDRYDIRVANFSLHSTSPSSFRWDPLDKAVEQLWFAGVVVVAAAGNEGKAGKAVSMAYAPANDPFVITVGALDLHDSTDPDRADVPSWSAWGYTLDGFAKPELAAPGRSIVGPVPLGSTLAAERPRQVIQTAQGTYMRLSGTSLAAPIVAGMAYDLVALRPELTPDDVKGALMVGAHALRKVRTLAAGVGEVSAPAAAAVAKPPNPNLALDAFLVSDSGGDGLVFDDVSWLDSVRSSADWDAAAWVDGWSNAAWSDVSWSDVSWSDVSWLDVSWSDVSWSDVSWSDVSWADVLERVYGDVS